MIKLYTYHDSYPLEQKIIVMRFNEFLIEDYQTIVCGDFGSGIFYAIEDMEGKVNYDNAI